MNTVRGESRSAVIRGITAVISALIGLIPLETASAAVAPPMLFTGGYSANELSLSTTTDTLPDLDALAYVAQTGAVVVRTYKLVNHGEATLLRITIDDPDTGRLVSCGSLAAWSSATCTVRFAAVAGMHRTRVVASGLVDGVGKSLNASADAGYFAATPSLQLNESLGTEKIMPRDPVMVPIGSAVRATYTLSNDGDIALLNLSVSDGQPVTGLRCGTGATEINILPPGSSAICTAVLHAAAGLRNGSSRAIGTESGHSISASGPGAPGSVEAVAYSGYLGFREPVTVTATPSARTTAPASATRTAQPKLSTSAGHPVSSTQLASATSTAPSSMSAQDGHPAGSRRPGHTQAHSQSIGSNAAQSLPTLVRRHRRALSLLMILFVVAFVPAVRLLLRRG